MSPQKYSKTKSLHNSFSEATLTKTFYFKQRHSHDNGRNSRAYS